MVGRLAFVMEIGSFYKLKPMCSENETSTVVTKPVCGENDIVSRVRGRMNDSSAGGEQLLTSFRGKIYAKNVARKNSSELPRQSGLFCFTIPRFHIYPSTVFNAKSCVPVSFI